MIRQTVLPADEGSTPWAGRPPADVPVTWDGDPTVVIGKATVSWSEEGLVAEVHFFDVGVEKEIGGFGVYGRVVRDSFHDGVRTIEEVDCVGLGATRA